MDLVLKRNSYGPTGIFSDLGDSGGEIFATVEHAYKNAFVGDNDQDWLPKLPAGTYRCVRGQHQLHSGPIETFEILGVPGHTGVLFHYGNTQDASEGCVCVGTQKMGDQVTESRAAFAKFMQLQEGVNEFQLVVKS